MTSVGCVVMEWKQGLGLQTSRQSGQHKPPQRSRTLKVNCAPKFLQALKISPEIDIFQQIIHQYFSTFL